MKMKSDWIFVSKSISRRQLTECKEGSIAHGSAFLSLASDFSYPQAHFNHTDQVNSFCCCYGLEIRNLSFEAIFYNI